jgi:hypothetical protein
MGGVVFIDLAVAGGGGTAMYLLQQNTTKDEEVDEQVVVDIKFLREHGFKKIGLLKDDERLEEVLEFYGPGSGSEYCRRKVGKDGYLRFSVIEALFLYCTHHHISCYKCFWDVCEGGIIIESTDEFYYQDIVAASTKQMDRVIGGNTNRQQIVFELRNSGGSTVDVALSESSDAKIKIHV